MDALSIVGVMLALVALLGGSVAKGSGLAALWNLAAFLIVVIGTLAATLVNSRPVAFFHAMRIFHWVFSPPVFDAKRMIKRIVNWSYQSRKDGLLVLETAAERESDPFVRKALGLLVDGTDLQSMRQVLESDLYHAESFDIQAARVFESMGIYSPTLGIIGAVMGLMAVMQNLAEPSRLGQGIAAAFVATIYGIGFANLLFLPASNKLKSIIHARTIYQMMVLEGFVAIGAGENPRTIEIKLNGFLPG